MLAYNIYTMSNVVLLIPIIEQFHRIMTWRPLDSRMHPSYYQCSPTMSLEYKDAQLLIHNTT